MRIKRHITVNYCFRSHAVSVIRRRVPAIKRIAITCRSWEITNRHVLQSGKFRIASQDSSVRIKRNCEIRQRSHDDVLDPAVVGALWSDPVWTVIL